MNMDSSETSTFLIIKSENNPMGIARNESIDSIYDTGDNVVLCRADNPIAAGMALNDIVTICMAAKRLGLNYIAVNDDGQAHAFIDMPEKKGGRWTTLSEINIPLESKSFKELRKPVSIKSLLIGFTSDTN